MVDQDFSFEKYLQTWRDRFGSAFEVEEKYYCGDQAEVITIQRLDEDQFAEAVETLAEIDALFYKLIAEEMRGSVSKLDKDKRTALLFDEAIKIEVLLLV